jgi:hypothetical protein
MDKEEIKTVIIDAFKDVQLGSGVSLKQAEAIDSYCEGVSERDFMNLPRNEITDNWQKIDMATLEELPYLAHLDDKGFRYYIPAFMISVLEDYDHISMRVICTLMSLCPKKDQYFESRIKFYSIFNDAQNKAIACFLTFLPEAVELAVSEDREVEKSLVNYWEKFVPEK